MKRPTHFTPVSLLRKLEVIPVLGNMSAFHYLHSVPFFFLER